VCDIMEVDITEFRVYYYITFSPPHIGSVLQCQVGRFLGIISCRDPSGFKSNPLHVVTIFRFMFN
jgi:hypothetical protein